MNSTYLGAYLGSIAHTKNGIYVRITCTLTCRCTTRDYVCALWGTLRILVKSVYPSNVYIKDMLQRITVIKYQSTHPCLGNIFI